MISSIKKKVASLKLKSIQESNASGGDLETFYQIRNQRSPRRREISNSNLTTASTESLISEESADCSGNSSSVSSPGQLMPGSGFRNGQQLSPTLSPRYSIGLPSPRLSVQSSTFQVYQSHIRFIFLASGESGRKTLSKLIRYNLEPEVIAKQAFDLNQSYSTLYFFLSNTIILLEQFYQMLFEVKFPNRCINELPPILANVEQCIVEEIVKDLKQVEDIPIDREFSVEMINKLSYNVPMASNGKIVLTKLISKEIYGNLIAFFEREDVKLLMRKYHDVLQTQQHGTIFDRIEILKSTSYETLCELLEKPSNKFTKEEENLVWRLFFIARQKLTGCSQFSLQLGPHKLSFCLVAGQRAERKKYPRYIEQGFEYVIFCMNLSEYNRNLYENDTINRFRDTIYMAHEYCCQDCKKYGNMSVIPVFTHLDQLMRQLYYGNAPNSANVWLPMCEEIAKLHSKRSNLLDFIFSTLIPVKEVSNKLKYFAFILGYPKEEYEMKLEKEESEMQLFIEPPPVENKKSLRLNENLILSYYDWRVIAQFLQPRELIKMSETCKSLHQLTSEDFYWKPAVKSSFGINTAIAICGDGANFLQTEGFKQFIRYYQECEPPLEETDPENYISDWKCSYKWFYLFGWSCVKIQKLLYSIVLTRSVNGVIDKAEMVNNCKVALSLDLSDWKVGAQIIERSNLYNKFL